MTSRLTHIILVIGTAGVVAAAHPASPVQTGGDSDLKRQIERLSAFDYTTRTSAARMLRRANAADAVPALADAVEHHSDQFVRYRALVLLTAFNARITPELMRQLRVDRNDRVREVVYRWLERHPDPSLTTSLVAALETEQAEFVRPALIRAVAALPADEGAQRALVAEIGRGFDFFRSIVIEVLGEHRASYAVDPIASIAAAEGPLQDDAVVALGRIGGPRSVAALAPVVSSPAIAPAVQAAQCMLGSDCAGRITWLADVVRGTGGRGEVVRAAVHALGVLASRHQEAATSALIELSASVSGGTRDEIAAAFAGAAVREPQAIIEWLGEAPDMKRHAAIELLHEGFERLEEDFAEEQFFAEARATYWAAPEGSARRALAATLIDKLEF